jgi:hypothetical protein
MATTMLLLSLLIACTCGSNDPDATRVRKKSRKRKAKAAKQVEAPEPPPGPPEGKAVATTIKLVNDTGAELKFDRSRGALADFGLVRLDGKWTQELVWLDSPEEDASKDYLSRCVKTCSGMPDKKAKDSTVESCEPTAPAIEAVAGGAALELPWSGNILANRRDTCVDKQGFEAGKYLLTYCPEGGPCASTEVQLPSSEPIELKLSSAVGSGSCEKLDRAAMKRATEFSARYFDHYRAFRKYETCPMEPQCVDEAGLEAALKASKPPCNSIMVARPDGDMTLYFQFSLPPGMGAAPPYIATWDPSGTKLRKVELGR